MGIGEHALYIRVVMKLVFTKPVMHVLALAEGIDATTLADQPTEELSRIYLYSKAQEADVQLQAHPDIIVRQIGEEWILVPTGELAQHFNGMVSLNEFGYFIWQQLQQPHTIGEVLQAASETYGNSLGMQDIEIRSFIHEYALMGLFHEVNNNNK